MKLLIFKSECDLQVALSKRRYNIFNNNMWDKLLQVLVWFWTFIWQQWRNELIKMTCKIHYFKLECDFVRLKIMIHNIKTTDVMWWKSYVDAILQPNTADVLLVSDRALIVNNPLTYVIAAAWKNLFNFIFQRCFWAQPDSWSEICCHVLMYDKKHYL